MSKKTKIFGVDLASAALIFTLLFAPLMANDVFQEGSGFVPPPLNNPWHEGDLVPPELLRDVDSLSAGQTLDLSKGKSLFFSNIPELPQKTGILHRVDNVLSQEGDVRILYSHFNLLYDSQYHYNPPAKIGVFIVNNTNRTVKVYRKRFAQGVNRSPDGTMLYSDDLAPLPPGHVDPIYYGTQLGNAVIRDYFRSNPQEREQYWTTLQPGEKVWDYSLVGGRGWAIGIVDVVFRDQQTNQILNLNTVGPGEKIGVRSFIARDYEDLENFFQRTDNLQSILHKSASYEEHLHMRGFFLDGIYPTSPYGEGISRRKTISYNAYRDGKKSIMVNVGRFSQNQDPAAPHYRPEMFLNDILRNGTDPHRTIDQGKAIAGRGDNNGSYGVDYNFDLQLTGPTAIVIQESMPLGEAKPPVDMFNQFLTAMLDQKAEQVKTMRYVDPHYYEYFRDFQKLQPLGKGRVFYALPQRGEHQHTLTLMLPPNSYAPYRVILMPLEKDSSTILALN